MLHLGLSFQQEMIRFPKTERPLSDPAEVRRCARRIRAVPPNERLQKITRPMRELLVLLYEHERHIQAPHVFTARLMAAGGLARATALLEGICVLIENWRADSVGVLSRAIFEVCGTSLYLLLTEEEDGRNPALEQLLGEYAKGRHQMAGPVERSFGFEDYLFRLNSFPTPAGEGRGRLPRDQICVQVDKLLEPFGDSARWADVYAVVYRGESLMGAHPSIGVFDRYLTRNSKGIVRVQQRRDRLLPSQAHLAADLVLLLAQHVYRVFGVEADHERLAALHRKLMEEVAEFEGLLYSDGVG